MRSGGEFSLARGPRRLGARAWEPLRAPPGGVGRRRSELGQQVARKPLQLLVRREPEAGLGSEVKRTSARTLEEAVHALLLLDEGRRLRQPLKGVVGRARPPPLLVLGILLGESRQQHVRRVGQHPREGASRRAPNQGLSPQRKAELDQLPLVLEDLVEQALEGAERHAPHDAERQRGLEGLDNLPGLRLQEDVLDGLLVGLGLPGLDLLVQDLEGRADRGSREEADDPCWDHHEELQARVVGVDEQAELLGQPVEACHVDGLVRHLPEQVERQAREEAADP
mmetsp:Transcript_8287/g.22504  ORF Transcript_8287/g.22504 Transcript_8287/m.22504 type:complete len:282 (-) Transcript_8287:605-1450(-)